MNTIEGFIARMNQLAHKCKFELDNETFNLYYAHLVRYGWMDVCLSLDRIYPTIKKGDNFPSVERIKLELSALHGPEIDFEGLGTKACMEDKNTSER